MTEGPERKYRRSTHARILRRGAEDDAAAERAGDAPYDFYDSEAESFDGFFSEVLAPYSSIHDYLEAVYGAKRGELVAIELGGPARRLFATVNADGLLGKSAGFTLHDGRNNAEREEDEEQHHDVVEADVFFRNGANGLSWRAVEEWVEHNGKPDLIVQRMVQGVGLIRKSELYVAVCKRWLSQLSEGGTLLAEIPRHMSQTERQKVVQLLSADDFDFEEIAFGSDVTCFLARRVM